MSDKKRSVDDAEYVRKPKLFKPLKAEIVIPSEVDTKVKELDFNIGQTVVTTLEQPELHEASNSDSFDVEAYQAKLQLSASMVETMASRWLASVGADQSPVPIAKVESISIHQRAPRLGLGAQPKDGDMLHDDGFKVLQRQVMQGVQAESGLKQARPSPVNKSGPTKASNRAAKADHASHESSDEDLVKGGQRKVQDVKDPFARKGQFKA